MSSNKPTYMQADWFNGLLREVAATSITAVAAKLGIKRPTLSLLVNGSGLYGSGKAKPDAIELRFRQQFEQLNCPHTGKKVGVAHCREMALRRPPTHNPLLLMQWQACQECSYLPAPLAGVAVPVPASKALARDEDKPEPVHDKDKPEPVQQAGIIDKVTLPLPEVGGPQVSRIA